jgi:nucleotide-binding universal stress UspA family protein
MAMKPKILVAYDFGSTSERALAWAGELARSMGGAPIAVLYVVCTMPGTFALMTPMPAPPATVDREEAVAAVRRAAANHQIDATVEIAFAPEIGPAILAEARRLGSELIVIGTHGRGGLKRLALGSVAEYLVRHADCPVVTLREKAA